MLLRPLLTGLCLRALSSCHEILRATCAWGRGIRPPSRMAWGGAAWLSALGDATAALQRALKSGDLAAAEEAAQAAETLQKQLLPPVES
eukprot:COSAG01_NODE_8552_length_2744_cov_8.662382_3_plen_89_part_00